MGPIAGNEAVRSAGPGPSAFWRWASCLIVGLVLVRGFVVLCVLPPFEGWDEYQHVGYVERMRQGEGRPVLGEAVVPPELMARLVAFPQPHTALADGLGQSGAVGYAAFWARYDPRRPETTPPKPRPYRQALYQAQHGPLYYRLAAPWFAAAGGTGNPRASIALLRLGNLILTAAAVALVLGVLRRVVGSERLAALLVLPLACHPLFLLNGARVANDALGVLLASVAVGLGLALALGRGGAGRRASWCALALGIVTGLATQAKATNLALLPFAGACWLVAAARGHRDGSTTPGQAARAGLVLTVGLIATGLGDLAFNLAHHGLPTAMQEALVNRRNGRTSADLLRTAETFRWGRELRRLWTRELYFKGGWSFLRTAAQATLAYQFLAKLGLIGWAVGGLRQLGRRSGRGRSPDAGPIFSAPAVPALLGLLVLSYSAALAYHMVQSKLAWGTPTTCPWYACPALPWFLALVGAGGLTWWPVGRLRESFCWSLAVVCLAGEIVGVWGWMVPTYAAGADSTLEALRRLAVLQPTALGTATLLTATALEVALIAALALTFRDAARAAASGTARTLSGPHAQITAAGGLPSRDQLGRADTQVAI